MLPGGFAVNEFWSVDEFAGKVDWEGGVTDALEYGLSEQFLNRDDPACRELHDLWAEARRVFRDEFDPLVSRINELLFP